MKSAPSVAVALLLVVCSTLAAPAQEPPATPKAAPVVDSSAPSQKDPRFKATLVILEADWSKAPTAKQIEQDLQAALKDVPIPDSLRQNLAASGPQILFAPEQFHAYRPEDANSLFVWLDQHKLIKTRIDYVIPDRAAGAESDDDAALAVDLGLLPVKVRLPPPLPFVRQRVQWRWSFFPGLRVPGFPATRDAEVPEHSEATIIVLRRLVEFEEFAGEQKQRQRRSYFDDTPFGLSFPRDRVAVVHALVGARGDTSPMAARELGAEAVLLVRDASLSVPALEGRGEGSGAVRVAELIQRVSPINPTNFRSALAEGRPRGPSAPPRQTPAQPAAEQLKIFSLKQLDAKAAASIVSQLFESDSLAVAVDERGNTLIARGDEAKLAEVEAVLLRLDEEPPADAAPGKSPPETGRPGDVESHAAKYRELEKQAAQTAAEHQQLRAEYADSHPQATASKDRLRQQVSAAFEARQQWQNAELIQLRARLAAIEQSLSARERIKDTIIDRRVEELLDPDLHWESGDSPVPQESAISNNAPLRLTGPGEFKRKQITGGLKVKLSDRQDPVQVYGSAIAPPALDGFCPVTFADADRWTRGRPEYSAEHNGRVYRLADEESLARFRADPTRYTPAMNGRDVVLAQRESRLVEGDRRYGMWFRGRMFLFQSDKTLEEFCKDPRTFYVFAYPKESDPDESKSSPAGASSVPIELPDAEGSKIAQEHEGDRAKPAKPPRSKTSPSPTTSGVDSEAETILNRSLQPFQGRWQFESVSTDIQARERRDYHELRFEGRQFVFSNLDVPPMSGMIKSIDATKIPAAIDMEYHHRDPSVPETGMRKLVVPAIFKFEGDRLTIARPTKVKVNALEHETDSARPKSFESSEDVVVCVWKRASNRPEPAQEPGEMPSLQLQFDD